MKILFIGGTGNISASVSKLTIAKGHDLYLLHRGKSANSIEGANELIADINDPLAVSQSLSGHYWDVVVNWIAFTEQEVLRDIQLFQGKTKQYIFISSASAYQKPMNRYLITESTPLINPVWLYSRDKIACELALLSAFKESGFPATIVRPSLTYDTVIPVPLGGWQEYTIVDRIKKGKEIIVHGDGTSLWTITHARDFSKGFVGLMGNAKSLGEAFHITSDEVMTWDYIYKAVAHVAGREPNIVHMASDFICKMIPEKTGSLIGDKSASAVFDNSKIKSFVPEFTCEIRFAEGIAETIAWMEASPERMIVREETNAMMDRLITKYKLAY